MWPYDYIWKSFWNERDCQKFYERKSQIIIVKKFYIAKARRLRGTPFSSRIERQGLTAYTTYNHMLLPAEFEGTEKEYLHLKEHVQVWDVAAERQVQKIGKDSEKLFLALPLV